MKKGDKPTSDALILTVVEVARRLGMTEAAVRSAVARGRLPARRWGHRVVFLEGDLADFVCGLPRHEGKPPQEVTNR
jgi:excisionase family DNA binding protein